MAKGAARSEATAAPARPSAADRVATAATAILLVSTVELAVGFAFIPIVVRQLGPAQYGDYASLMAAAGIAQVLTNLGLFSAIRKGMTEERASARRRVASGGLLLCGLLGLGASVAGIALALLPSLPLELDRLRFPIALVALNLLVWNVFQGARSVLFGLHRESSVEPLRVVVAVVSAVGGIVALHVGLGVSGLLIAVCGANGIAAIISVRSAAAQVRLRLGDGWVGLRAGRQWVTFGVYTTLGIVFAQLLYYADLLIVVVILGSSAAGVYRAALLLSEMLWIVPGALQVSLLHNVSGLWARDRRREIGAITDRAMTIALLLTGLLTVGLVVLAGPFVRLYFGPPFAQAVLPMQILVVGAAAFALARILNPLVEGTGLIRQNVLASGLLAALNVGGNLLVIPRYGLLGAAIVSATTYVLKLVQLVVLARRTAVPWGATIRWGRILIYTSSLVVAAVGGSLLAGVLGGGSWLTLAIGGGLLLAVAGSSALGLGLVGVDELRSWGSVILGRPRSSQR